MNGYFSQFMKGPAHVNKQDTLFKLYKAKRELYRKTIIDVYKPKPLAVTILNYWMITNATRGLQCFDWNMENRAYGWVLSTTFKVSP